MSRIVTCNTTNVRINQLIEIAEFIEKSKKGAKDKVSPNLSQFKSSLVTTNDNKDIRFQQLFFELHDWLLTMYQEIRKIFGQENDNFFHQTKPYYPCQNHAHTET
jgi:hypothetical protein